MSLAKMEGEFDRAQLANLKAQADMSGLKSAKDEISWYEMKEKQVNTQFSLRQQSATHHFIVTNLIVIMTK